MKDIKAMALFFGMFFLFLFGVSSMTAFLVSKLGFTFLSILASSMLSFSIFLSIFQVTISLFGDKDE